MAAKERIRVVVVDNHPIMRDGLRDALGGEESPRPCMECHRPPSHISKTVLSTVYVGGLRRTDLRTLRWEVLI